MSRSGSGKYFRRSNGAHKEGIIDWYILMRIMALELKSLSAMAGSQGLAETPTGM
jgi:hypothetical protein